MVGTKILGQMGSFATKFGQGAGFAGTVFGKDGSGTERSNYMSNKEPSVDKSFQSTSGGLLGVNSSTQGAVGGIGGIGGLGSGGLDSSLMNNILSTPSSEKSHGRTSGAISPDDKYKQ